MTDRDSHSEALLRFGRKVRVHSVLGNPFKLDTASGKQFDEAMGHLVDTRNIYLRTIAEHEKLVADLAKAKRLVRRYRFVSLCFFAAYSMRAGWWEWLS